MEKAEGDRFFTVRELWPAAALLTVYGILIFFSPDTDWVLWAGPMAMGALDVSAAPLRTAATANGALETAAGLGVLGLLIAAFLVAGLGASGSGRDAVDRISGFCERSHGAGGR